MIRPGYNAFQTILCSCKAKLKACVETACEPRDLNMDYLTIHLTMAPNSFVHGYLGKNDILHEKRICMQCQYLFTKLLKCQEVNAA